MLIRSSLLTNTCVNNVAVTTTMPRIDNSKTPLSSYAGLERTSDVDTTEKSRMRRCDVLPISIAVDDGQLGGSVPGFLHLPQGFAISQHNRADTAAILLSGAGGGVVGPSSMYLSMADKLAGLRRGMPVLRLDYRFPARLGPCYHDIIAAMAYLRSRHQIAKFVLVGWSFGSAPVFTVAAGEPSVVGCATIAGQTADTSGIRKMSPRPLLLLHGMGDRTLSPRCSEMLYENYGRRGSRKIHLFEGDDHALTKNSLRAEEMLCDFIARVAGVPIGDREQESVIKQQLVDDSTKVELMKKGGDLRGSEKIE